MDIRRYNRDAWNRNVEQGNRWTVPVAPEEIARARRGEFAILLTPTKPVPASWFPPLADLDVLCLASGGGQQGPILAAAGARVTVFDNSPAQLAQDRFVAEREGLSIRTVEGDMADLSALSDASFDFVFHPCSNGFSETVRPVWREAFRVLRPGGTLVAGLCNPVIYLFDRDLEKQGVYQLRYGMPFAESQSLEERHLRELLDAGEPLSFAHSLEDLIGGQLAAGFRLIDFFEDDWGGEDPLDRHFKGFFATRAEKPGI